MTGAAGRGAGAGAARVRPGGPTIRRRGRRACRPSASASAPLTLRSLPAPELRVPRGIAQCDASSSAAAMRGRRARRRFGLQRPGGLVGGERTRQGVGGRGYARCRGVAGVLAPDDVGFYDDVGRPPDHDQVLDIVSSDQNKLSAAIDGAGLNDRQPRCASTRAGAAERAGSEPADQPGGDADQRKHHHECNEKADGKRCSFAKKAIHRTYRPPCCVGETSRSAPSVKVSAIFAAPSTNKVLTRPVAPYSDSERDFVARLHELVNRASKAKAWPSRSLTRH